MTSGIYRQIALCPLCGSGDLRAVHEETNSLPPDEPFFEPYREETIRLKRCGGCGFAFVDKIPKDPVYYEKFYGYGFKKMDWDYEFRFHGKGIIFRDVRRRLLRYAPKGRLLDVGSWCGTFAAFMSPWYEVHGVELNRDAAAFARKTGIQVTVGRFHDVDFAPESFDVVTLLDVLEHLPEPGLVLRKAASLLKPGGIIFIKVPNYHGQLWKQRLLQRLSLSREGIAQNYSHINHFSRTSLGRALRALGLDILESGPTQVEVWNLAAPMARSLRLKRSLVNMTRRLSTEIINLGARIIPVEFEFNLFMLARKAGGTSEHAQNHRR